MITIQLCGMIILGIIIYFSSNQNRLRLKTNIIYLITLNNTVVTLLLDIISILAIINSDKIHYFIVEIICKLYLVSLNSEAVCGLIYTLTDALSAQKNKSNVNTIICVYLSLTSLIILASPIEIVYKREIQEVYTEGLACISAYNFVLITIVCTIVTCLVFKKNMLISRYKTILIWMLIWMIAVLIQLFNSEILIVSFACVLGIMIIYFQLENPEKFTDSETGYFNQQAFTSYIEQMYHEDKKFSILLVCDSNAYSRLELTKDKIQALRNRYVNYLRRFSRLTFIYEHDKAILAFNDPKKCNDALNEIIKACKKEFNGENELLRPLLYTIYDSTIVNSSESLISILNYTFINLQYMKDKHNYTDITADTIEIFNNENRIISMIHRAIKDDRIEVFYQPIYSTKKQKFTSAEALVRVHSEDGSIIPPGTFIDVVEKSNLILKIGQIVFRKVCKFISEHNMEELGLEYIEINLSVIQCAYQSLALDYIKIMQEYGIDTKYINLEITESASIDSKQILLGNMNKLINHGITFSLDDFGTGQSNLNYIMEMPVDIVKFDKSMTSAYFENDKSQYIMDAAMHMIKGLKLKIVAEGIETEEQFNIMSKLGIDYIQGYYFSKPLPEKEFIKFVEEKQECKI